MKKILKYLKRVIASPFVLGIMLITHWGFAIKRTWHFIRWGGEFIQYPKDERVTIESIYHEIKRPKLTVSKMRDLDKQVASGEISYSRMIEIINNVRVNHTNQLHND